MAALTQFETLPGFAFEISYGSLNKMGGLGAKGLRSGWGRTPDGSARPGPTATRCAPVYSTKVNDTRTAVRDTAFRLKNAERLEALYRERPRPAGRARRGDQRRPTFPGSRGFWGCGGGAERVVHVSAGARPARREQHRAAGTARGSRRTRPDRTRRHGPTRRRDRNDTAHHIAAGGCDAAKGDTNYQSLKEEMDSYAPAAAYPGLGGVRCRASDYRPRSQRWMTSPWLRSGRRGLAAQWEQSIKRPEAGS